MITGLMSLWKLIIQEILHRKLGTVVMVTSVAVATACVVGAVVLLKADEQQTSVLLAKRTKAVEDAGAELQDAMRKITKGLGFNVVILPEDQDLQQMHLSGAIEKTMPESYVDRLANSDIVTVNHLLPTTTHKLTWPEHDLPVIVNGTRGEVPIAHRDPKKPLLDSVPRGKMITGFQIAQKLGLEEGKNVTLSGREFEILKTHGERGSIDDSTVWINLREAQEMFEMENLIHAIQALECHCAGDRITQIRNEIAGILPGTQVIERGAPALARAEARNQAKLTAEGALEEERISREELRTGRERLAAIAVPFSAIACASLIGLAAFSNVRNRRQEIAILGALGLRGGQVLMVFLGKALIAGIVGGLLGIALGIGVGALLGDAQMNGAALDGSAMVLALATALGVALMGSWIPAFLASRQDAATVLQQD